MLRTCLDVVVPIMTRMDDPKALPLRLCIDLDFEEFMNEKVLLRELHRMVLTIDVDRYGSSAICLISTNGY